MTSIDGEKKWSGLIDGIQSEEESKRFIRLNVQLDGEPKLDDLSKMLLAAN